MSGHFDRFPSPNQLSLVLFLATVLQSVCGFSTVATSQDSDSAESVQVLSEYSWMKSEKGFGDWWRRNITRNYHKWILRPFDNAADAKFRVDHNIDLYGRINADVNADIDTDFKGRVFLDSGDLIRSSREISSAIRDIDVFSGVFERVDNARTLAENAQRISAELSRFLKSGFVVLPDDRLSLAFSIEDQHRSVFYQNNEARYLNDDVYFGLVVASSAEPGYVVPNYTQSEAEELPFPKRLDLSRAHKDTYRIVVGENNKDRNPQITFGVPKGSHKSEDKSVPNPITTGAVGLYSDRDHLAFIQTDTYVPEHSEGTALSRLRLVREFEGSEVDLFNWSKVVTSPNDNDDESRYTVFKIFTPVYGLTKRDGSFDDLTNLLERAPEILLNRGGCVASDDDDPAIGKICTDRPNNQNPITLPIWHTAEAADFPFELRRRAQVVSRTLDGAFGNLSPTPMAAPPLGLDLSSDQAIDLRVLVRLKENWVPILEAKHFRGNAFLQLPSHPEVSLNRILVQTECSGSECERMVYWLNLRTLVGLPWERSRSSIRRLLVKPEKQNHYFEL